MVFSSSNRSTDAKLAEWRATNAWAAASLIAACGLALIAATARAQNGGGDGAAGPTKSTLCAFFSGPQKGLRGPVFPEAPIGSPCHDDAGSNGVIVSSVKALPPPVFHSPADAGLPGPPQLTGRPGPPLRHAAPRQPMPLPMPPPAHAEPHRAPAAVPSGGAKPVVADPGDLDAGREESAYDSMKREATNGTMPYDVPKQMTVGEAVTVRVDLLGSKADPGSVDFAPSGVTPLKVSPLMQVTLSGPDNPDAFTIVADPVQSGSQIVPADGKAEWSWKVTPKQGGSPPKMLHIDAYMMLNEKLADGEPFRSAPIRSATVSVPVSVKGFGSRASGFLANNWSTLLGYILPSGAGAALLVFFLNRRKAKAD